VSSSGRVAAVWLAALTAAGCARLPFAEEPRYVYLPDRRDYAAFRAAHPTLLEPNYLPFMVHRFPVEGDAAGDILAFCRWPDEAMPLPVHVAEPVIPEELQDEFRPVEPEVYVTAVAHALLSWERELEGLVRFRRVARREDAALVLALIPEEAPTPETDRVVLGTTPLGGACRSHGWDPDAERLLVHFEVPELRIFLADAHGLLADDQVEWIALHEIGHALGMRGHSPIPADLMYEVVRDRVQVHGLSTEDVNSFVSLYQQENGSVFGRVPPGPPDQREPPPHPTGPPQVEAAPHVDPRLGFSIQPPRGWMRVEMSRGMVAVDGVTWDYTASLQVIVQRYDTIDEYLARFGAHYLRHGSVVADAPLVVNGRRARRISIEGREHPFIEDLTFIEAGDGRVLVIIADCPLDAAAAYRPWFQASLATLEIWEEPGSR
jgi:hypothetical protein